MKEPKVRYLVRWTCYKEIKKDGTKNTKVKHFKNGIYETHAHFERKGKVFSRVTKWKYIESKKIYSKVTKSWNEVSYQRLLRRTLNRFNKTKFQDFDSSIQKFSGHIISPKKREIKGSISKCYYLPSIHKLQKEKLDDAVFGTAINDLLDRSESIRMFQYEAFIKRKRKKKK